MASSVSFFSPGGRFPAYSVTGDRCALQCDHCRGRYLRAMRPTVTPGALLAAARDLQRSGGTGLLLSGGCDRRGRVPLGPFLDALREIKRTTSLVVNLHTGLVDEEEATALLATGVDAFSVDVLQDRRAIADVLHLDASPKAYRRTMELLAPSERLVPHTLVGLQSELGEAESLDLIASFEVRALIVLGLVPPPGAPFDRAASSEKVTSFIRRAVNKVNAPVLLGCMRPRGRWEDEKEAIEAGASGVVNPSPRTAEWAERSGLEVRRVDACCAVHL